MLSIHTFVAALEARSDRMASVRCTQFDAVLSYCIQPVVPVVNWKDIYGLARELGSGEPYFFIIGGEGLVFYLFIYYMNNIMSNNAIL